MHTATDLAARLARNAEAVCRAYLPNGRKRGNYWIVGNAAGAKGSSLYVRLHGPDSGPGAAGKWTDAATGDHGDLLDIIKTALALHRFPDVLAEAHSFLSLPRPLALSSPPDPVATRTESARRLFHSAKPLPGTFAERYLRGRAVDADFGSNTLRFHPSCYYRSKAQLLSFPAMLAAVTDLSGTLQAVHRTWLSPDGLSKAPVEDPRRAMGPLIGNAARFGQAHNVLIAGEGLETVLSIRTVLPFLPAAAALTANHLSLLQLPLTLDRLYIALDNDTAGDKAWTTLSAAARAHGITPYPLVPDFDDWNTDLQHHGPDRTRASLISQLAPADRIIAQ